MRWWSEKSNAALPRSRAPALPRSRAPALSLRADLSPGSSRPCAGLFPRRSDACRPQGPGLPPCAGRLPPRRRTEFIPFSFRRTEVLAAAQFIGDSRETSWSTTFLTGVLEPRQSRPPGHSLSCGKPFFAETIAMNTEFLRGPDLRGGEAAHGSSDTPWRRRPSPVATGEVMPETACWDLDRLAHEAELHS